MTLLAKNLLCLGLFLWFVQKINTSYKLNIKKNKITLDFGAGSGSFVHEANKIMRYTATNPLTKQKQTITKKLEGLPKNKFDK